MSNNTLPPPLPPMGPNYPAPPPIPDEENSNVAKAGSKEGVQGGKTVKPTPPPRPPRTGLEIRAGDASQVVFKEPEPHDPKESTFFKRVFSNESMDPKLAANQNLSKPPESAQAPPKDKGAATTFTKGREVTLNFSVQPHTPAWNRQYVGPLASNTQAPAPPPPQVKNTPPTVNKPAPASAMPTQAKTPPARPTPTAKSAPPPLTSGNRPLPKPPTSNRPLPNPPTSTSSTPETKKPFVPFKPIPVTKPAPPSSVSIAPAANLTMPKTPVDRLRPNFQPSQKTPAPPPTNIKTPSQSANKPEAKEAAPAASSDVAANQAPLKQRRGLTTEDKRAMMKAVNNMTYAVVVESGLLPVQKTENLGNPALTRSREALGAGSARVTEPLTVKITSTSLNKASSDFKAAEKTYQQSVKNSDYEKTIDVLVLKNYITQPQAQTLKEDAKRLGEMPMLDAELSLDKALAPENLQTLEKAHTEYRTSGRTADALLFSLNKGPLITGKINTARVDFETGTKDLAGVNANIAAHKKKKGADYNALVQRRDQLQTKIRNAEQTIQDLSPVQARIQKVVDARDGTKDRLENYEKTLDSMIKAAPEENKEALQKAQENVQGARARIKESLATVKAQAAPNKAEGTIKGVVDEFKQTETAYVNAVNAHGRQNIGELEGLMRNGLVSPTDFAVLKDFYETWENVKGQLTQLNASIQGMQNPSQLDGIFNEQTLRNLEGPYTQLMSKQHAASVILTRLSQNLVRTMVPKSDPNYAKQLQQQQRIESMAQDAIKPAQRIPRYKSLLDPLTKMDSNFGKIQERIGSTIERIDRRIR